MSAGPPDAARRRRRAALVLSSALVAAVTVLGTASMSRAAGPGSGDDPLPGRHHGSADRITVASYNIHAGAGQDNVFDLDRLATQIASLDADVVGLQEVDVHWGARSQWQDTLQELGQRLHMQTAFAPIYDLEPSAPGQPRRQYGVALLSRHPIISSENHDITRLSTQVPDAQPAPAPGFLEAVVRVSGRPLHVYVTHLDYRADPRVRELQVADTRRLLAQDPHGAAQLLLGDFNAEPTAPELAPLWESVGDAWVRAAATGPGSTYPAGTPVKRIDYVTVSSTIRVLAAAVPDDDLARLASDHRPVSATVRLPHRPEDHR